MGDKGQRAFRVKSRTQKKKEQRVSRPLWVPIKIKTPKNPVEKFRETLTLVLLLITKVPFFTERAFCLRQTC